MNLDPSSPFTTREARDAGITPGQLRGPAFRRLLKGVHVAAGTPPSPLLLVQAALSTHPADAFASHLSAATVLGIPVPPHPYAHVSVVRPDNRRRRQGVVCHRAAPDAPVRTVRGIRVSAPLQTFVELAAVLVLVDLVAAGDYIVSRGWCTPAELVAHCASSRDRHSARALEAARFVRSGVDSVMETRIRMLLVLAGFPEPQVNLSIRNEHGDVVVRFDLSYPVVRVAVEYDGRQHADSHAQYDRDIDRRERLDSWRWRIVVVTSPGVFKEPGRTLDRVAAVLRERGLAGVPARFDDRWRAHFPGYA